MNIHFFENSCIYGNVRPRGRMETFKYKGFISYSHADEKWGSWLHRKLETFRFPRATVGRETKKGAVPRRFTPVFRDRDELTASSDLGAEIQESLRQSENLIVLCSPNAAQSHWVNKEIQYFKKHNNPDNIFAFIIDGEPFAPSGSETLECFPKALRYELDESGDFTDQELEPLAADAREQGDGKSLALLKILSGMAGLGLDELVQRDLQRARRRVTGITAAALATVLVMGSLTWVAVNKSNEADQRRADAEGLIEFMLTDLRDRLEPVGKLDILDAVGQEATSYYDGYDVNSEGVDAIGQRARTYHLLGDIQLRLGNIFEAKSYFEIAFDGTEQQLQADPLNPDRIYEHIQSVYWIAAPKWREGDYQSYLKSQQTYLALAERLSEVEGDSDRAVQEMAYGLSNVGRAWSKNENSEKYREFILRSQPFYQEIVDQRPTVKARIELASRFHDIANSYEMEKDWESAYEWEDKRFQIINDLYAERPENYEVLKQVISTSLARAYYQMTFEHWAAAQQTLESALVKIDNALQIEPKNDQIRKAQLRAHKRMTQVAEALGDYNLQKHHSDIFSELLTQRLKDRQPHDFDLDWDYAQPYQNIKSRMNIYFSTGDFENAKTLLPLYEEIIRRIEGRKGFEIQVNTTKGHYLISKSFLEHDPQAFEELSTLVNVFENQEGFENFVQMHRLLRQKYCKTDQICQDLAGSLVPEDLKSGAFFLLKQKHPDIAQTIESDLKVSRREK